MPKTSRFERRYTYGDYVLWKGDERWELIDGAPFLMSPSPGRRHQEIVVELLTQIRLALADHPCQVFVAPFDVRLPNLDHPDQPDEQIQTVVQPDLMIVCDEEKLDDAGIRGAPDWVVEVVSPSTRSRDQVEKRDLYERHGVREYWIVDPETARLEIYCLDEVTRRFEAPSSFTDPDSTSTGVLPDVGIDWSSVFGR